MYLVFNTSVYLLKKYLWKKHNRDTVLYVIRKRIVGRPKERELNVPSLRSAQWGLG